MAGCAPQVHPRVGDAGNPGKIVGGNVVVALTIVVVIRIDPVHIAIARSYEDTPESQEENSCTVNILRPMVINKTKARAAALSHHCSKLIPVRTTSDL